MLFNYLFLFFSWKVWFDFLQKLCVWEVLKIPWLFKEFSFFSATFKYPNCSFKCIQCSLWIERVVHTPPLWFREIVIFRYLGVSSWRFELVFKNKLIPTSCFSSIYRHTHFWDSRDLLADKKIGYFWSTPPPLLTPQLVLYTISWVVQSILIVNK